MLCKVDYDFRLMSSVIRFKSSDGLDVLSKPAKEWLIVILSVRISILIIHIYYKFLTISHWNVLTNDNVWGYKYFIMLIA